MANKILTPTTLWSDFDDSLPVEETVLHREEGEKLRLYTVRFSGRAVGEERVGIFARYAEPSDGEAVPALLILPDADQTIDDAAVRYFASLGYAVLMPDYRGSWRGADGYTAYPEAIAYANLRQAERRFDHADDTARETCWFEWVALARYCVRYLRSKANIGKIGVIGVRAGGDIAWQLAATCDDLACAIPVCAGGWRAYRGVNKYGDAPELKMDDERYRFIAGVESQSYAPYVKCPVLMLCSTNDEFFDADRAFDTFSRIASDCDKTFYFAARYNGHIGNTGLKDLELFIGKYLRGREVFIPAPAEIAIDEDADGELVARIRFDRNGEVRYCEVYMAEEMCESAMRDWVRCERKESAGEDEQVFRLNTVRGARRVFAYAKTKYSCGFAVSSKIAVKRLEKDYANSVERCRILYSSRNGRDSFTVARFDRGGTLADCFLQNSLPPVNLMEGPCGIEGIASAYGLKSFRINDPRYRPSENALLKFDVYAPETTTMQITVRAEKNGRDILYQCNLFLPGCESWIDHVLSAKDFKTDGNRPLAGLSGAKYISFCAEGRFCINNLLWL